MTLVKPTLIAVFVVFVSAGLALANSVGFFTGLSHTPPGTVYLGTVHYWEDYFLYLNHFLQGSLGLWLVANRYTNEWTPDSPLYWTNLLMGKFGGILGLNAILSYNVSLIVLSFAAIIFSYFIISKLVFPGKPRLALFAFMVTWFGTSLINRVRSSEGPMIFWPFQIWKTPHFAFDRLGGAPHQMVITILFYVLLASSVLVLRGTSKKFMSKYSLVAIISGLLLASIQPVQAGMFVGCLWFTIMAKALFIRKLPDRSTLGIIFTVTAVIGATMAYMTKLLSTEPHIQTKIWEAAQQSDTTWPFLFLSLGPVMVILAFAGVLSKFKHFGSFDFIGLGMVGFGYLFFMFHFITRMLDVANVRVLFPVNYIFWGVFSAYGADWLTVRLKSIGIAKNISFAAVTLLFLVSTMPTIIWEFNKKIITDKDRSDMMLYLPKPIDEAFEYLKKLPDWDDTVLANAGTHLDTLVPAFSGHTTYSGHILATTRNAEKQAESRNFFRGNLSPGQAQAWLTQKNIKYILFTSADGDRTVFMQKYPFLTRSIYTNSDAIIFAI